MIRFFSLFLLSLLFGSSLADAADELDPRSYPKASRISYGTMATEVLPEKYLKLSSPLSGRLNVKIRDGFHEKDTIWAEFEPQQIALEREALELTKELYELKEKPGARLEMADARAALENRRDEIKRNLAMVSEVLSDPELAELFLDQKGSQSADSQAAVLEMKQRLTDQLRAIDETLAFVGTPEQERIEIRISEIQLEKKEEELQRKERESRLRLPFSGEFRFLVKLPDDLDTPLSISSNTDIAELQSFGRLECHLVVSRSEIRQLPVRSLYLQFAGSVPLTASFARKETREVFGKSELIYVFQFPENEAIRARSLIGGRTNAELFVQLASEAFLIPKLDLIRLDPETFRDKGWRTGVAEVLPGYQAISIGQSEVAVIPTEKEK